MPACHAFCNRMWNISHKLYFHIDYFFWDFFFFLLLYFVFVSFVGRSMVECHWFDIGISYFTKTVRSLFSIFLVQSDTKITTCTNIPWGKMSKVFHFGVLNKWKYWDVVSVAWSAFEKLKRMKNKNRRKRRKKSDSKWSSCKKHS